MKIEVKQRETESNAILVGIQGEKGGLTYDRIERKASMLRSALQSNQGSLCRLHANSNIGGEGPDSHVVSTKRKENS